MELEEKLNLSLNRYPKPLIPEGSGDKQQDQIDEIKRRRRVSAEEKIGRNREELVAEAEKLYNTGSEMDRDKADELMLKVKIIDKESLGE
ncbi:MAG TPA: hypothetical protein PKZ16_02350 [bacterium]|nr:hypothetical protein [bacterium]HPL95835.1 hypothetical protein [bacterium]